MVHDLLIVALMTLLSTVVVPTGSASASGIHLFDLATKSMTMPWAWSWQCLQIHV